MSNLELEKRYRAVWRDFEKRVGYQFSKETRDKTEDRVRGIDAEDTLEALEGYLEDVSPILLDVITNSHNPQPKNDNASPKKRYYNPLERRLHLVNFVATRKHGKRIDWKRLSVEWNKENPSILMTPAVLKAEYHRAKKDKAVQLEYAKRYMKGYAPQIEEFASSAEDSSLAQEEMWQKLGSISLYSGKAATSGTVEFTSIALPQTLAPIDERSIVDFSKIQKKGGTTK